MSFIFLCVSCNKKVNYSKILENAQKIVKTNPDSASFLLSEITDINQLTDVQKADYGYLTALSHSLNRKAMTEDDIVLYTLDYYKNHNATNQQLAETYKLASRYYFWIGDNDMSKKTIEDGLTYFLDTGDSALISEFYYWNSELYFRVDYRKTIQLLRQSVEYEESAIAYYQLGLSYAYIGNIDSVTYYILKAVDIALQKKQIDKASHYKRNYADILYEQKRYAESLDILKDTAYYNNSYNTSIARAYIAMRQPDSAQIYIDKARSFLNEDSYLSEKNFVTTLQAVVNYAKGERIDWHSLSHYYDQYQTNVKNNELITEEKQIIRNKLEQENLMLAIDKQRTQLYITWALIFIGLIAVLIFIYIRKKRNRLIEAEEKQEVLEKLLKEATTLTENKDDSFFKKVLLQQLGLIRLVASTPTSQNQELLKQVSLISNKDIPVEDMLVWNDLYKLIDSIYNSFYSKLITNYGNKLTEKEIQLCCLLCAGFSTKEISVVSQQSLQTIYQRKTTIRQKLKMDEKQDIVDYIKS